MFEEKLKWKWKWGGCYWNTLFCGPSVCDCQGLKMDRNKSTHSSFKSPEADQEPLFYFFAHILLYSLGVSRHRSIPITLPFPLGYFLLHAFHSPLCDVTPVVCQTEGRRCLMRPLCFLFFSQTLFFFPLAFIFKWSPPTQCCDTAFLSIGWQCGSRGISLFSFFHFFFSRTHILHFSPLPPSSHLHPSRTLLSRGAVSQSLTHSATHKCVTSLAQRRHHAARCPPRIPRWPGSEVLCFSGGLEGIKCYFKSRKHCVFLLKRITGHAWGKNTTIQLYV